MGERRSRYQRKYKIMFDVGFLNVVPRQGLSRYTARKRSSTPLCVLRHDRFQRSVSRSAGIDVINGIKRAGTVHESAALSVKTLGVFVKSLVTTEFRERRRSWRRVRGTCNETRDRWWLVRFRLYLAGRTASRRHAASMHNRIDPCSSLIST